MGTDHRLKPPAQQLLRKLLTNLVGQFRRYFPGGKALNQMESLDASFLVPYFFNLTHILKGCIAGTTYGRLEQILF